MPGISDFTLAELWAVYNDVGIDAKVPSEASSDSEKAIASFLAKCEWLLADGGYINQRQFVFKEETDAA